jgi:hypothetical protein
MMDLAARSDAVAHGRVMAETALGSGILNRPAALFVAIGLFLMAFFTLLWASWSFYHLSAVLGGAVMVIFGVFAAIYVINGVQLFRSASRLPLPVGEESQRRGRVLQRGFTITLSVRAWSSPSSACCLASRRLRVLRAGGRADRRPALHSVRLPLSPHDRLLHRGMGRGVGRRWFLADRLPDVVSAAGGIARGNRSRLRYVGVRPIHAERQAGDCGGNGDCRAQRSSSIAPRCFCASAPASEVQSHDEASSCRSAHFPEPSCGKHALSADM